MDDRFTETIAAGEDLSSSQFHAIALDDGKVANNGKEAAGVLLNKPESGDHASICIMGASRYAAGGAVTKGSRLTVATSGWFTAAASGYPTCGRALTTVTSGSIGRGVFNFAGDYISTSYE